MCGYQRIEAPGTSTRALSHPVHNTVFKRCWGVVPSLFALWKWRCLFAWYLDWLRALHGGVLSVRDLRTGVTKYKQPLSFRFAHTLSWSGGLLRSDGTVTPCILLLRLLGSPEVSPQPSA